MAKWHIVSDSSCDLYGLEDAPQDAAYTSIPFVIRVGGTDYVDDEALDVPNLVDAMEAHKSAGQTACPSPDAWLSAFREGENNIALTISGELSGSMGSAQLAKSLLLEEAPEGRVILVDSRSAGAGLVLLAKRLQAMIAQGMSPEAVEERARHMADSVHTIFALGSFDNLVKSGRMSRLAGLLAGKLGIWGVGVSDMGKIKIKSKVRGANRALVSILQDMAENGFRETEVVISHCLNLPLAEKLRDMILEKWREAAVTILPTRGLCSYYAERGGLIVAY